jgi:hypothetical protein
MDSDSDGIGDNADPDDDNDGVEDSNDAFPLDPYESEDSDDDGIGDNADSDDDNDGISDEVENAHPNGGDGNNDSVSDSIQNHISSFLAYGSQDYVTLEALEGMILNNCQAIDNPSPADVPTDLVFPYGLFSFTIDGVAPGGSTTISITLPAGANPNNYYKYGPTPGDASNHWYEFMHDGETGAIINGNIITLYFVDGERGDSDLDGTNGTIVEPGGPGIVASSTTPAATSGSRGGCFITSLIQSQGGHILEDQGVTFQKSRLTDHSSLGVNHRHSGSPLPGSA